MTVIDQPINLLAPTQSTEHRPVEDAARGAPPREKGPGGRNLPFAPNLARPRQQPKSGLRARRRPGGSTAHRASRPPGGGPFDGALPHTRAGETVEGEQVARRRGEETSDDSHLPGPSTSPRTLARTRAWECQTSRPPSAPQPPVAEGPPGHPAADAARGGQLGQLERRGRRLWRQLGPDAVARRGPGAVEAGHHQGERP